jgi:hypothetical protein
VILTLLAALAIVVVEGPWLLAAVSLIGLGVVLALVGVWADRKVQRGEFRRPEQHGA